MKKRKAEASVSEEEKAEGLLERYDPRLLASLKGRRMGEIVRAVLDCQSPRRADMTVREELVAKAIGGLMGRTPTVGELLALQRLEEGSGKKKDEEKEKAADVFDARLREVRNGEVQGACDGDGGVHGDVPVDRGQGHGAGASASEQGSEAASGGGGEGEGGGEAGED